MFYFGTIGSVFGLARSLLPTHVVFHWFTENGFHEALTVVAGVVLLLGVQLLMNCLLSDPVVTLHHKLRLRIEVLLDED